MEENYFGITDTGKVRSNNEDTFIAEPIEDGRFIVACVIDGVGGYSGGEIAAEVARKTIMDHFKNTLDDKDKADFLKQALLSANDAVYNERQLNQLNNQMACVVTLVVADVLNNKIFYAHVGDTRLYLFRDNTLVKISHDHSFVGFLEDSGRLTESEAMNHTKRNEINKALGFDSAITSHDYIETGESPFLPGDIILLCSDGLSDMIDRNNIMSILNTDTSLKAKGRLLIDAANNAGGKDNITVVMVKNDKSAVQHVATKPVAATAKSEHVKQEVISTEYVAPVADRPKPVYKGSGAVPILSVLSLLLLAACIYLVYQYYQNKRETKNIEPVTTVAAPTRGEHELQFIQKLSSPANNEVFMVNNRDQPFTVSDSFHITGDTLHIIGNGITMVSNGTFKGPAFIISPQAKYVLLDSMVLQNFDVGILLQNNALHLNNVVFKNCRVPVRYDLGFSDSTAVNGQVLLTTPISDTLLNR